MPRPLPWLTAALGLCPALALAQPTPPPRWRLDWTRVDGAEACPTARAMEDRVRALLRRDPFDPAATASLEVVVERDEGEWVAHLFARDGAAGSRVLRSPDARCDALADMAALAMALVIDPGAPTALPAPAAQPPPPAPPTARPFRAPRPPLGQVLVEAAFTPGALPGVAMGVGLGAQLPLGGTIRLDAGAWLFPEGRTTGRDVVTFSAVSGRLGVCATLLARRRPALELDLCGGALLGWVNVVVDDPARYASVHQGARVNAQVGAWGAASWRVAGPLVLRVELGATVPLVRPDFAVEGREGARAVFQAWPVVPWIALGPGLRF